MVSSHWREACELLLIDEEQTFISTQTQGHISSPTLPSFITMADEATPESRLTRLRRLGLPKRGKSRDDAVSAAIARVLFPVMICMALAIYLVHSVGDTERECFKPERDGRTEILPEFKSEPGRDVIRLSAIIFICIFVGCIVLFTFLLVCLYRFHCEKFIFVWLFVAVLLIFCYVGGLYLFSWSRARCLPLDWVTLSFIVWNFAVVGLISIFWKAPRIVNQGYLIVMSALMAYIFRTLPDWATWIILGVLVVWDLFAVLAPCGPLKMLVEAARERGDPLPALVYDTNPAAVGRDPAAQAGVAVIPKRDGEEAGEANKKKKRKRKKDEVNAQNETDREGERLVDAERGEATANVQAQNGQIQNGQVQNGQSTETARRKTRRRRPDARSSTDGGQNGTRANADNTAENEDDMKIGTLGVHLKLGLGDFVFYSVLVAQASQAGAMTAVTSFLAILFGLCATLLLVVVFRMALPALPISIVLGLVFYFLTRYTVQPFVENILPELLLH
eukprot:Plantae.Rhodophyta-Hildenbrandia_rubra.ctg16747.p1 GENE.Plantae.Rhodophyta-Hildenbrandia_rubra.ctg16747~~Plantae.Rhodophyta-Hildenbrandia_rubra.ctg16747.p1  ORF type:complete len:505 (-),score=69.19 Plantae.Rhodophyta-Hildenbrandia_rubra.ctg16747:587-2101(-)